MANGSGGAGDGGMTSGEVQSLQHQVQGIQAQLNGLVAQVSKLEALCETTAKSVDRAHVERQNMWVEIRGYGEKLVQITNEFKNFSGRVTTDVAKLEIKVDSHDDTFLRQEGAGKFAIAMSKVLWAIGGAVVAGAGAVITFLMQSGGNTPGR